MSAPTPPPSRPRYERPRGTLRIGSIGGSDVLVTSSWFLIAGLIAVVMAPAVERVQPGLGGFKYVAGLAFAILLYLSVLMHEASHALMARRLGFEVPSITLHFLGGLTAIDGETEKPRQEFLISVVGPLTSIAVGVVALGLHFVVPDGLLKLAVDGLAGANLLVGVLNLVPGLPLDGGRVLKAAVWGLTGNMHRGTLVAGWGGRVVAVLALGYPFLAAGFFGGTPDAVDFVFAGLIAMFLWQGATAAIASAKVRSRLPQLVARDLARRTLSVPGDLPLSEAVRRAQDEQAGGIVTVTSSGNPVGIVNEAALMSVPVDRRPWVAVSTVARTLDEGLRLPVAIAGEELVRAITARPSGEYLLVDPDGAVYGVLATSDVDRAFRAVQG
ncbi:MAG: M50 family metallopeptidase [Nocardioides sp.]